VHDPELLVEATVGSVATDGNAVSVLRNGAEIFPAMLEAITAAQDSVLLLTYVYWTGDIAEQVADALCERARTGVDVRVLVDWIGGRQMDQDLIDRLEQAGCTFAWFRPPSRIARAAISLDEGLVGQHRTHRKVLVCDGRVGFTGGVGIAAEWTGDARGPGEWRDTHLRIEGPAATSLVSAFATNWHESTGAPLPPDVSPRVPAQPGGGRVQVVRGQPGRFVSDVALVLRALLGQARERIWIETAYFVPDEETVGLLVDAAERGVDVRLLVPGPRIDKRVSRLAARESFASLLDAGIAVNEFQPTMLHCKVVVVDDVAVTGSANCNMRSLEQDDEVVVVLHDRQVVDRLASDLLEDLERSESFDPDRFEERSTVHRLAELLVAMVRRFL